MHSIIIVRTHISDVISAALRTKIASVFSDIGLGVFATTEATTLDVV